MTVLARRLGYRSRRGVAMVFAGSRVPSSDMTARLSRLLKHDDRELHYLNLLVTRARLEQRGASTAAVDRELAATRPTLSQAPALDERQFAAMSAWYFLPLKQLVEGPGFREDLPWLRQRLRRKVTQAQLADALAVMHDLGMISRGPTGCLQVDVKAVTAGGKERSLAVRRHHRQMLERALEALDEQPVAAREFNAATLAIDPARLEEAKVSLRDFVSGFAKRFHSDASTDVCQLNVNLFSHTAAARPRAAAVRKGTAHESKP